MLSTPVYGKTRSALPRIAETRLTHILLRLSMGFRRTADVVNLVL